MEYDSEVESQSLISLDKLIKENPKIWCSKVKVISKTDITRFEKRFRSGTYFNFTIIDENVTKLNIICFNHIAEKFSSQIELDKTYYISNGDIKKDAFYGLQLFLNNDSKMELCEDNVIEKNLPTNNLFDINKSSKLDEFVGKTFLYFYISIIKIIT